MRFIPASIELPMPLCSRLHLRQGTHTMDGWTDNGHQHLMPTVPHPMWGAA